MLSWDGGKNHLDKELQAERAASKRHWSDEYNQEIDAGKVKHCFFIFFSTCVS